MRVTALALMARLCDDELLNTGWGKAGATPLLTAWGLSFQEELDTASFLR